jgi:anti-sigma regulatory factor (Ser/Thr protein kinase)
MDERRLPLEHDTPASSARRLAENALQAWDLTERTDDVLLVASELVQNVTKHTDDGGEFRLSLQDDAILIEVTDTNPTLPRQHAPEPHVAGGRGLLLITAVARRWGSRPAAWAGHKGKVVWAELAKRLIR